MKKKKSNIKKIVLATSIAIFSLANCFVGVFAWFVTYLGSSTSVDQFVVSNKDARIDSVELIKFDYDYDMIGGQRYYKYLNPESGNVNVYQYDADNEYFYYVDELGVTQQTDVMEKYDPVDNIIHGLSFKEMNCNAIYKITFASGSLTNCYLQLFAELFAKTPGLNQILLSDCLNFDVYYESDLADDNPAFYNSETGNYDAYYPSYVFDSDSEELMYYKIQYLSFQDGVVHKNFYEELEKPSSINLARNVSTDFSNDQTLTVYINVNYEPSKLDKYYQQIYINNIIAIYDFYFRFVFTDEAVS